MKYLLLLLSTFSLVWTSCDPVTPEPEPEPPNLITYVAGEEPSYYPLVDVNNPMRSDSIVVYEQFVDVNANLLMDTTNKKVKVNLKEEVFIATLTKFEKISDQGNEILFGWWGTLEKEDRVGCTFEEFFSIYQAKDTGFRRIFARIVPFVFSNFECRHNPYYWYDLNYDSYINKKHFLQALDPSKQN